MQSRAILPSWYGVGRALEACASREGGLATLQAMYGEWPFFRAVIDNAQLDVAKADTGIAALYNALVEDEALREAIFGEICAEHARACRWICAITGQGDVLANTPVIQRSIERRNPYVDPLNFIQVALLRDFRRMAPGTAQYDATLNAIMMTVNGIAAGMKTTG
jgi:phosphoenolpyruvate carboxylase